MIEKPDTYRVSKGANRSVSDAVCLWLASTCICWLDCIIDFGNLNFNCRSASTDTAVSTTRSLNNSCPACGAFSDDTRRGSARGGKHNSLRCRYRCRCWSACIAASASPSNASPARSTATSGSIVLRSLTQIVILDREGMYGIIGFTDFFLNIIAIQHCPSCGWL